MANELMTVGTNQYEKSETFKYVGSVLADPIHKEVKFRMKAENSFCYSFWVAQLVRAPAHKAGDPGENFSLKLTTKDLPGFF